jgi:coenzyme F420 hydrogenase subunit beta
MKNVEEIVKSGLCVGCGLCTYSEAIGETIYSRTRGQSIPALTRRNKNDDTAFKICPAKGYNIQEEGMRLFGLTEYDLELGYYYKHYAAYSNNRNLLHNASSGGIMTEIALYLLENDIVDRVVTTCFEYTELGPRTKAILAASKTELLSGQGSKYCPVDLSDAIRKIKNENLRVVFIGTPCHIAGIRNIQQIDPDFSKKIILTISNFCGGFKSFKNINSLAKAQNISSKNISFFRFRGGGQPGSMLLQERGGKKAEAPYPKYVGLSGVPKHLRCHLCVDATAELADIACGDAWVPRFQQDTNPWSVILTRSQYADALLQKMIQGRTITTEPISIEEIKLSQRENLRSKKVRQKSRFHFYKMLGYKIPWFGGGYYDNEVRLPTEVRVFAKHKLKQFLEFIKLYYFIYIRLKKK